MPVYSVLLNTAITSAYYKAQYTNLNQVSWNINFDDLFKGDNEKYKNCRVRYNLISTVWIAGTDEWGAYAGYLTCNLPSSKQLTQSYSGTALGLIYPTRVGGLNNGGDYTISNAFNISTLQEGGIDISVPQGLQQLQISLVQDNPTGALMTWGTYPHWMILLSFELY
jgi:hypothetical protein